MFRCVFVLVSIHLFIQKYIANVIQKFHIEIRHIISIAVF